VTASASVDRRLPEGDHGRNRVPESLRQPIFQLLLPPPCRPSPLANLPVALENLGKGYEFDLAVRSHLLDRPDEFRPVDRVVATEEADVGKVSPACAEGATRECRHDLLGIYHHERVTQHDDLAAEEPGKVDFLWSRGDRVTNVDVDVEMRASGRALLRRAR